MKNKTFNIIISGTGGQGLITLLQVLAEASLMQGFDVKTAELHGLSQRGGSVSVHARLGKKVCSPLIFKGSADLILSLEVLESLRVMEYVGPKTVLVINDYSSPFIGIFPEEKTKKLISQIFKKGRYYLIPGARICQDKLGKEVLAGIYLLAWAARKRLLPLNPESIRKAIIKVIPENYLDMNLKAFKLAQRL